MLNGRLRSAVMVAGVGLGWTLIAPQAATAQCTYYLSASTVDNVSDAGASGSLSVAWSQPQLPLDVDLLCGDSWVAGSNVNWISLRTSLTNNAILYYTVDANPTASARTGTITVSGQTVTIEQLTGCPSSPQVSPTSLSFTSAGGSKDVTVQEAAHCRYAVSDNQPWISVPTTVSGNGRVRVTVPSYDGTRPGFGTVTIGTQGVPVRQDPPLIIENTPPVAADDTATTQTNTPVAISVLANDTDADNDALTVAAVVRAPAQGTAVVNAGAQTITYTPPTNWTGVTTFTYRVTDGSRTAVATVTVTVNSRPNHSPVAVDDSATTQMNTPVAISVLANDTDADNDSLTVAAVVQAPAQGTAVVDTGAQTITYTPPTNWTGVATFTYRVTDGSRTAVATVTVTVRSGPSINNGPVAVDDTATTQMNTPVAISVLANDTDAENDSLTVAAVVQAPAQGTAVVDTGAQTITYTPPTNWTGVATFTYRVTDGSRTAVATVTVTVPRANRPPTANAGVNFTVAVGHTALLNGAASNDPEGFPLLYEWTQTSGPDVTLFNNRSLQYRTNAEQYAVFLAPATVADTDLEFSLVVTDEQDATSEAATVTVTLLGAVLTQHRDRLLADWASRDGRSGNACAEWGKLYPSEKMIFIWNTHRLHVTNMLSEVTRLYAIYGMSTLYSGNDLCGGGESNRMFMSMTPELRDKLVSVLRDNTSVLPLWRPSRDSVCGVLNFVPVISTVADALFPCPHPPYSHQVETNLGSPRGQINFWAQDVVAVSREYGFGSGGGFEHCGEERLVVNRVDVCSTGDQCSGSGPYPHCATHYSDTVIADPSRYSRGPASARVTITDALSFEMDQDYGFDHKSNPACNGMQQTYSDTKGDPNWSWNPTACGGTTPATGKAVTTPSAGSPRAVYITDLRDRVDALRGRFGLAAFTWTDATITPEVTPVKAVHLTELRAALNGAYRAANRDVPAYTDPVITPRVTPIRLVHMTELRRAVVALEP